MRLSPFELLGVEARFDLDLASLEKRFRDLSREVHPDRSKRVELSSALDLNAAYRTLRDDLSRARAVLAARGVELGGEERDNDPAFLMEVMELREALGEAREARDLPRVERLAAQVREAYGAARTKLARALDAHEHTDAKHHLGRMRYYRRFLDEVDVIEEEAALG